MDSDDGDGGDGHSDGNDGGNDDDDDDDGAGFVLRLSKTSRRTLEGRPTMSGGFLASQVKVPLSLNSRFLIRMEPSRRPGFPTNSTRSLKGPLLST